MNLNKLILTGMFLSASAAYSGTMGPVCDKDNLTTLCANTGFDVAGRALYLQPAYSGSPWVSDRTVTNTVGNVSQDYGMSPGYGWGFFLEASYHYNKGKDYNLNWYSFDSTSRQSNNLALGGSRTTSIKTSWNAVNLEFGKAFKFGDMDHTRLHAGVQYARLQSSKPYTSQNSIATPIIGFNSAGPRSGVNHSGFNGFGPRAGIDFNYDLPYSWMNGFKAYANGAVGLLAGTTKFYKYIPAIGRDYQSLNHVVPELDLKLGFNYVHEVARGQLTFDAGWMWADYLSVASGDAFGHGDISFQGVFFGLKWLGNIA